MRFFRFQLSHRWQRRLSRFRDSSFGWVLYPLQLTANLFREIGRLVANWWSRRNLRFLLQGLPALFVAAAALTFGVVVYFQDRNLLANYYRYEAQKSLYVDAPQLKRANQDNKPALAMAQTCYQRLASIDPDEPEYRFGLAQVLLSQEQIPAAAVLIRKLAPSDRTGYGPAHVWLAGRLLSTPPDQLTRETVAAAENHLRRATTWKDRRTQATAYDMLAKRIYYPRRERDLAIKTLAKAAEVFPSENYTLAEWYSEDPTTKALSQNYAKAAANAFTKQLAENVDDHRARIGLINSLTLLGNFADAKHQADEGMILTSNADADPAIQEWRKRFNNCRYLSYLNEYQARTAEGKWSAAERYRLLEQALAEYPNEFQLYSLLVAFTRQQGEEGAKANKLFADLESSGQTSAIAHLIRGSDAWQQKDTGGARYHWKLAFEATQADGSKKPNFYALQIANNYAFVLIKQPPIEPEKALGLIDQVIKEQPDSPLFHSTRGHILAAMGKHQEALEELKQGLKVPAFADTPELFDQLAETCEKLGYQQDAKGYKLHADELRAKAAPPATKTGTTPPAAKTGATPPASSGGKLP